MKTIRLYTLLFFALVLSGCSAYTLVSPGESKMGELSLDTGENWSQISQGGVTVWTKDGIFLNRVGLEKTTKGKHILNLKVDKDSDAFVYDPELSLEDTVELFLDALSTNGFFNVALKDSGPSAVSDYPAIRFHYQYDSQDNLTYMAKALFIKKDGVLYKLVCIAPTEHYYPKYEPEFERILASANF